MIKLTFVGDIMCKADMLPPYRKGNDFDFSKLFKYCSCIIGDSDLACANLETPISYDNKNLTDAKWCFNSPFEFAKAVKEAGFNFVATANNHCLDRGLEGIASTTNSLDKIGLNHTGVFADRSRRKPLILDVKGVKFGMLAYTYGTNAFSNHCYLRINDLWHVNLFQMQELWNPIRRYFYKNSKNLFSRVHHKICRIIRTYNSDKQPYERKEFSFFQRLKIKKDIRDLQEKGVDIIIMYMHAGGQYNYEATTHTHEICDFLRKEGVNIIVGSHEHVVHGCSNEYIDQNSVETYSLGNFDGIAGVYAEPMDKMAEYSIAWHVYIDLQSKKIAKTSYTILKTVKVSDDGVIQTIPVHILYENEEKESKKKKLFDEIRIVAQKFSGNNIDSVEHEYFC